MKRIVIQDSSIIYVHTFGRRLLLPYGKLAGKLDSLRNCWIHAEATKQQSSFKSCVEGLGLVTEKGSSIQFNNFAYHGKRSGFTTRRTINNSKKID